MAPTPRAHQLMPQIRQVRTDPPGVGTPARFDPATAGQRRFTLAAGDYADILLLPAIISRLRQTAPGIDIRVSRLDRHNIYRQLDRGEVDIALGGHLSGTESHYVRTLFEEHLVCIASRSHHSWRMTAGIWRAISACRMGCTHRPTTALPGLVDRRLAEIGAAARRRNLFAYCRSAGRGRRQRSDRHPGRQRGSALFRSATRTFSPAARRVGHRPFSH